MSTASPSADLAALQAAIAGTVITPDAPAYDALRAPAVPLADDVRPLAIVACQTAEDVRHGLAFAQRLGERVAPRSGGHCFAGRSTTPGIVLDVSRMDGVAVQGDVAVVGAGTRLGALYDALDLHGRTVPIGCGQTVGIAGLTLGGGISVLGRRDGLTCDRLVDAQVVLADGRIVRCDAEHHPDLHWGLRGAGGGQLGVVTSLTLRTLPAPETTTFHLRWPAARAAAVIAAWQQWAPEAPDTVHPTLEVVAPAGPAYPLRVDLVGAIHECHSEALALLDGLVLRVGADPEDAFSQHTPFREAKRWFAARGDDAPADPARSGSAHEPSTVPVFKSEMFRRDLPHDVIAALVDHLAAGRARGQERRLTFTPLGGAYGRVPVDATAFAHRRERFLVEHGASAPRAQLASARAWARRSWAIARPAGTARVYPNFPDPELTDWAWAYHGENLARLREVKRRYDPDRVFRFAQSL